MRFAWLIIYLVAVCLSCDNESSRIGTDFFGDGRLDISSVDSSKVILSTIRFDSLVTSKATRVLLGSNLDDKLGRITASAYFQPGLGTNTQDLSGKNYVFE